MSIGGEFLMMLIAIKLILVVFILFIILSIREE